ncbi:MAG TPA: hypothetical protein VKX17_01325 [Planctomycetota bacterium]|nr:hypothetical protein [Planctomycetota bacterium]
MRNLFSLIATAIATFLVSPAHAADDPVHHYLYVAAPGIRDDLKCGGHGLLVFDIDDGFKFVKRIPTKGVDDKGKPMNVKGICASKDLHCVYVSTLKTLECIDLLSEKNLWERAYDGGCDRMSLAPDSKFMYLPTLEKDTWHIVDPRDGSVIAKIEPKSGAHNTVISADGSRAFLGGLKTNVMTIADTATHLPKSTIEFGDKVRPFVINGKATLVYQCVNNLLGFEIGAVPPSPLEGEGPGVRGKVAQRVEVKGFESGKVARHGCPSHGIALTNDEKEVWVTDAHNKRMHIFDNTVMPPKYVSSIELRDEPGWVTLSIDGKYAIPSTGDVIEIATRKIVARLTDETGAAVQSEKLMEIDLAGGKVVNVGDQFSNGKVR